MDPVDNQNGPTNSFSYPTVGGVPADDSTPTTSSPTVSADDKQQNVTSNLNTPAVSFDANNDATADASPVVTSTSDNPTPAAAPLGESVNTPDIPPTVAVSEPNTDEGTENTVPSTSKSKKTSGSGALQALAKKLSGLKDELISVEGDSNTEDVSVDEATNLQPSDSAKVATEAKSEGSITDEATDVSINAPEEVGPKITETNEGETTGVLDSNITTNIADRMVADITSTPILDSENNSTPGDIVQTDPDINVELSSEPSGVEAAVDLNSDSKPNPEATLELTNSEVDQSLDVATTQSTPTVSEALATPDLTATAGEQVVAVEPVDSAFLSESNAATTPEVQVPPSVTQSSVVEPQIEPQFIQQPLDQVVSQADVSPVSQELPIEPLAGPSVADLAGVDQDATSTQSLGRYPFTIEQLLDLVVEREASDLHITVGYPVMVRVDGDLVKVADEIVEPHHSADLILPVLPEQKKELLEVNREVDLAYSHKDNARFRINAYYQQQTLAGAFRLIPNTIRSIDELNLPQIYHQLSKLKQGLVLVTGPTGSGKSTTLAAILHEVNTLRPDHIITIEDPIEYLLPKALAMVDQRELHEDTHSWENAMKSALRQDPDVILVGEMRDYETISSAITLAETGHLVFATLHTNSAAQTIDRIIDVFPEHQQAQVRSQLSNTIEAVVAQRLIPINGGGRRAVSEIMIATAAIRNLIREAKSHQIDNVIRTSADIGMISLEHSLVKLVRENIITMERAQEYSVHPEEVVRLLKI